MDSQTPGPQGSHCCQELLTIVTSRSVLGTEPAAMSKANKLLHLGASCSNLGERFLTLGLPVLGTIAI